MRVNELFEPKDKGKVGTEDRMQYEESKQIGNYLISFQGRNEGSYGWEVWFIAIDKDGNSTWAATEDNNEIKVFSFVVNAMRNFIEKYDPKRITFNAKKVEGSRADLYRKFVARFAKEKYITREFEVGLGAAEKYINFDLIKKPVAEALDKAVEFKVTHDNERGFVAQFESNGRTIQFNASLKYSPKSDNAGWEIGFSQRDKDGVLDFEVTKGGKEFEVFATLRKIIEAFLKKYEPDLVSFTADKSDANRASLYQRMFSKMLPGGYKLKRDDSSSNKWSKFEIVKSSML